MKNNMKALSLVSRIATTPILIVCFAITSSVLGQIHRSDFGRGITPLVTKKAEVLRLLGTPILDGGAYQIFDLKTRRYTVVFNSAKPVSNCRWNVSSDTIVSILIGFKKPIPLSQLKLDLTSFKRYEGRKVPGYIYYSQVSKGVFITSRVENELEIVVTMNILPTPKERKLNCLPIQKNAKTSVQVNRMGNRLMRNKRGKCVNQK